MNANRFATYSLTDPRILRILSSALDAVDPAKAVRKYLPNIEGNIYGLGIGKASIPMLTALAYATPLSDALAISKQASSHDHTERHTAFRYEAMMEITVIPLRGMAGPCAFEAAGDGVATNASAALVKPTQALVFDIGCFGIRSQ